MPLVGSLLDGGDHSEKGKAGKESTDRNKDGNKQEAGNADVAANSESASNGKAIKRSEEEKKFIAAGADNSIVLGNYNIYDDIPTDWIRSNVKILEHRTDVNAGTDTVTIYLELGNSYVNMTGTKEITYKYDEKTGNLGSGGLRR